MPTTRTIATTKRLPKSRQTYLRLAAIWPPHMPRNDRDYEAGAESARVVSTRAETGEKLDDGEKMYLEAVLAMLELYDRKHAEMPTADLPLPQRLLGLMDVSGTNQSEVADAAGISRGNMSDIMAGRRGLSKESIKRLSRRFRIGAEFFL